MHKATPLTTVEPCSTDVPAWKATIYDIADTLIDRECIYICLCTI